MRIYPVFLCALLAACASFPDLDAEIDRAALDAPYPSLVPIDSVLQTANDIATESAGPSPDRIARLRARAARLRQPVIGQSTRTRMQRGINTSGL